MISLMAKKVSTSLIRTLDSSTCAQVQADNESVLYKKPTTIIYEGHIPIVAYLIKEGFVELKNRGKVKEICTKNHIIGVEQLIHRQKCQFTVITSENCEVVFLDRSYLLATDHKQLKT